MSLFFNDPKSRSEEEQLIRNFLRCLDDMQDYIDDYDEIYGLAFNENEPMECTEKLINFLTERLFEMRNKR